MHKHHASLTRGLRTCLACSTCSLVLLWRGVRRQIDSVEKLAGVAHLKSGLRPSRFNLNREWHGDRQLTSRKTGLVGLPLREIYIFKPRIEIQGGVVRIHLHIFYRPSYFPNSGGRCDGYTIHFLTQLYFSAELAGAFYTERPRQAVGTGI